MSDNPEPVDAYLHRAQRIASDAERHVPSWLRPGDAENRLPAVAAIIAVIALQRAIPVQYTVVPRWPLIALELLLLVVLLAINPLRLNKRTTVGKWASLGLTAAITVDNTASAVILDLRILSGEVSNDAKILLGSGAAIFITNVIAFGIWYWELDRGGPFARRAGEQPYPDFLFPQMSDPTMAKPDWRPTFADYLYTSFTNVVAFSPTDTMPLTGDYEPSTSDWARENAEQYIESGGTEGTELKGKPVILLTTIGAKSGKVRKTPLMKVEHDGEYAVVASLGGAPKHPVWYFNIKKNPHVELQDGTVTKDYDSREVFGDEKAVWWERAVEAWPDYADYQKKTDRQIPVFVLTPKS